MWKPTLTFGLISGGIGVLLMLASIPFINTQDFRKADVLGYSSMVLAALFVFFGVRSYREHAGGRLSFGRGLAVGLLITLISCACTAVAFEIVYFKLVPDFGERFSACMVERARSSGDSPVEIEKVAKQAQTLKRLYDNPVTNAGLTFATSFPIGLVVAGISAAILRRR
jgi:Protein of unknown function (DUF4199)